MAALARAATTRNVIVRASGAGPLRQPRTPGVELPPCIVATVRRVHTQGNGAGHEPRSGLSRAARRARFPRGRAVDRARQRTAAADEPHRLGIRADAGELVGVLVAPRD